MIRELIEVELRFVRALNETYKNYVFYNVCYLKACGGDDAIVIAKSKDEEGPSVYSIKNSIKEIYKTDALTVKDYEKFLRGVLLGEYKLKMFK